MTEITVHELYELFVDTLGRCTSNVRCQPDDELLCNISEEFDTGVYSFLHDESLARLQKAEVINDDIVEGAKEIRRRWLALRDRQWTIEEIRSNDEWDQLFTLCDALLLKVRNLGVKE